ncbi:MAG TPA: hypothetical protein VGG25_09035, partial [Streptosporangiaceae bacterium]
TSSETLRLAVAGESGTTWQHAQEYAVMDRAGRVQLPRDMVERLGMRDRVRLQSEPDHIGVWPDTRPSDGQSPGSQSPGSQSPGEPS